MLRLLEGLRMAAGLASDIETVDLAWFVFELKAGTDVGGGGEALRVDVPGRLRNPLLHWPRALRHV